MLERSIGWIVAGALLGAWPAAAHADYLSSARASLRKGDVRSAQIELRNAVRADPQNAEAHYWLGRVALELGDPVAAEREANAARDRGYDPRQAVPLLTQALLTQGKYQDILDTLKPEGQDPGLDASILVSRGYAEVGLKRPDDARRSFAEAERAAPDAVEPLLADARLSVARADLIDAQAKIDRAIEAQPRSPEALLAKAQLLRLKGDASGATAVLDALVADQPSVLQARLDRAGLELAAGRNDAARADVDVVLKTTPGNVQATYLTAVMDAQAGNYRAADAGLERIAAYISKIQRAYYLLAVVKEQLGQIEQAEDAARRYLGRAPNDLAGHKILARIEFAKRRPDRVIDTLTPVSQSGKADAEAYDLLGRAYAATGQVQPAIDAFQKAETLAPADVGVQTRLAAVRMSMGDNEAAMGDLEHSLELAPKLPAVSEGLFFAALGTGDMKKAAEALDRIRAAQGDTALVGNLQGVYDMALLDFPGARQQFAAVLNKSPDFSPARINLSRVDAMLGDRAGAERQLQEVLARQPASNPALAMLSASYVQDGRVAEALALLEKAHAADPAQTRIAVTLGDAYIRAGTPQKALDLALAEKGQDAGSAAILGLRASAHLAMGQKREARSVYEQLLKQDPGAIGARRQLVALLVDAGEFETARSVLSAGMLASPGEYQLYRDYLLIDLKSTGIAAALATADRLRDESRDLPFVQALKGDAYLAANRPDDAAAAYREAFDAAPSTLLLVRLTSTMLRLGHVGPATTLLSGWQEKHPDDLVAAEQMSEIDISTHDLDGAAKNLRSILQKKPHDAVALNNLAWVCQQQGRNDLARDLGRQAYLLSPGPQTADTLGWILASAGDRPNGLALLRQAAAGSGGDPRILFHYAVALKESGDREEARKQLQAVTAFKQDFAEKTEARKILDAMSKGS